MKKESNIQNEHTMEDLKPKKNKKNMFIQSETGKNTLENLS
jgi:hypothetical protein